MVRHSLAIALGALSPVAFLWPSWRHGLEASMALHMLVEWPWLAASGALACRIARSSRWAAALGRHVAAADPRGILGSTALSCVSAFWMIPSAVDASLVMPDMAAFKFASWWLAGFALTASFPQASARHLRATTVSLATMLAAAGFVYIDSRTRLCVDYLVDDQREAGIAMVTLAAWLGAVTLLLWVDARHRSKTSPA